MAGKWSDKKIFAKYFKYIMFKNKWFHSALKKIKNDAETHFQKNFYFFPPIFLVLKKDGYGEKMIFLQEP